MLKIKFTLMTETPEGDCEEEVEIPAVYEICDRCGGTGKHTNPAIDGNGITASEWADDWDEDEREGYFAGRYDVDCEAGCTGGKVLVPATENLTPEQQAHITAYHKQEADEAEYRHMADSESKWERRQLYGSDG